MGKEYLKIFQKIKEKKVNPSFILANTFYEKKMYPAKRLTKGLRILILNAPCNGFGDLIFAIKFTNYLKKWYKGCIITIASTYKEGMLQLGMKKHEISELKLLRGLKNVQCRKFKDFKFDRNIPRQDIIFVAPLEIDKSPEIQDIKKLVPYANCWNTFFLSEYNDMLNKDFTFNTGIGKDRDGIMLTDVKSSSLKRVPSLKHPYAMFYVAQSVEGMESCIKGFIELVCKKYHKKYKHLDIVAPNWFPEELDKYFNQLIAIDVESKYYKKIYCKTKTGKKDLVANNGIDKKGANTLTFRCDILPVPNKTMLSLMKYSLDDILVTGDQSVTDVLSCCPKKNIFYQIAPWKRDLGKQLAEHLPNSYLKSVKTSCGTLKAIKYKSNYGKFVKNWDFRERSKRKMDALILSGAFYKWVGKDLYFIASKLRFGDYGLTKTEMYRRISKQVYELKKDIGYD